MIYSIFIPERGDYDYYESDQDVPLNADLPVPDLPAVVGGIGVPSIDAGRPLPMGARKTGQGWLARGMIARRSSGLGDLLLGSNAQTGWALMFVAGAVLASYWLQKKQHQHGVSR